MHKVLNLALQGGGSHGAFTWGVLDRLLEHLRDFYQQLWFAHPAPKMYAEKLLKRDFTGRGGFVMTGGLKDVRLMLSTAAEAGTKLEFGEIAEHNLSRAVDTGDG
jgi:3-hydroxyisobutyrate dehydrogenase-like beta-hydroxyacid dehydrogenase